MLKISGLGYLNTRQRSTLFVSYKKANGEKDIKIWKFIFQNHVWTLALFLCYTLLIVQLYATQSSLRSIYYSANSLYMFRVSTNLSSGVHKTLTTASGTGNIFVQLPPSNVAKALATLEGGSCTQKIWPVPEAVVTFLCTPDDGLVDTRNM